MTPKYQQFINLLDERIRLASSPETEAAYIIAKESFLKIFQQNVVNAIKEEVSIERMAQQYADNHENGYVRMIKHQNDAVVKAFIDGYKASKNNVPRETK